MPARIPSICKCLQKHCQRATYGALAGVLYGNEKAAQAAGNAMAKQPRTPLYSWIVRAGDGLPSGYALAQMHPDLKRKSQIIRTGLRAWLEENCPG